MLTSYATYGNLSGNLRGSERKNSKGRTSSRRSSVTYCAIPSIQEVRTGTVSVILPINRLVELLVEPSINIRVLSFISFYNFMKDNEDISDVLLEVCTLTRQKFGVEAELSLEVKEEYDSDDLSLKLYVRMKEYDLETMNTIDQMSVVVVDKLENRKGWFIVTTDFSPPNKA